MRVVSGMNVIQPRRFQAPAEREPSQQVHLDLHVDDLAAAVREQRPDAAELPDEQWTATFETNVHAIYRISRAALRYLEPGSTIVTSTSIQAYQPSPDKLDYASTKAAINTFTKALGQQLAPKGIRVNAVAPGPIWTPLQPSGGQKSEDLPEFGQSTPLGRAGQPTELAPAYVFLASEDASYISGETLAVTGGALTP